MNKKSECNNKEKLLAQIYQELSELSEIDISILLACERLLLASQKMKEEKRKNDLLKGENNEQKESPHTISKV